MAIYVRNCYIRPSRLFITGGGEISSSEGTTQADLIAMSAYGVGITPLFKLCSQNSTVKQAAFADDLIGADRLAELRTYWDNVCKFGPPLGYYSKASKSWLVVKEDRFESAKRIFEGTNINITTEGRCYLGGYIGKPENKLMYAKALVSKWVDQLSILADIAKSEPQAAYAAFVKGFRNKLSYHLRVLSDMGKLLEPLDYIIESKLIPALSDGYACNPDERLQLSLPVKLGGMALPVLSKTATIEYENSRKVCSQHIANIKEQVFKYRFDEKEATETKNAIVSARKVEELK